MSLILERDIAAGIDPAIAEARFHMRVLERAMHRGVGDRDSAVRHRVARASGVPESYLLRLHRRFAEMTDVSGRYARLLRLAAERLDERTERANARREHADRERLAITREMARGRDEGRARGTQTSFFEAFESAPQARR